MAKVALSRLAGGSPCWLRAVSRPIPDLSRLAALGCCCMASRWGISRKPAPSGVDQSLPTMRSD
jgi:hypothetical protein